MKLISAQVKMFKSIEDSGIVSIEGNSTVLVGQNESGKTTFLQALYKARPVENGVKFDITEDYPRRLLNEYRKRHDTKPDDVVILTYELDTSEIKEINLDLGFNLLNNLRFSVNHKYGGTISINVPIQEKAYLQDIIGSSLSGDIAKECENCHSIKNLISKLESLLDKMSAKDVDFYERIKKKYYLSPEWDNLLQLYIWQRHLEKKRPKFVYFDDYSILPGKVNLSLLQNRISQENLNNENKTVLGLLRVAGVELDDLVSSSGYEQGRAKLEGISNSITDKVFEFWTQNQELDVEFDIRPDQADEAPFNDGNNLYIRIRNRRHRVTVPFNQRSKGFIWFFSFIVWFDSIQQQIDTEDTLILLLDEPGLSLHALAQADFLRYIDELANQHQLIYTTHSPFMIHSDRLNIARAVQDRDKVGTKISQNVSESDASTLFPLQAALGYTIAQNLFISKRNLLVEGPSDLIYLSFFSEMLDCGRSKPLRSDITVVPVGGLDKLATFVALLRRNELELVVLHDYGTQEDNRLADLVEQKIIRQKQVLNYAQFRDESAGKATKEKSLISSDIEDLMSPALYIGLFNSTFSDRLNGHIIKEEDLKPGNRIIERISRYLKENKIELRSKGGFNHYAVANYLAAHPLEAEDIDKSTLQRFENLIKEINGSF